MLRAWQKECINTAFQKYSLGHRHFLAQATPGAGKTTMAGYLAKRLIDANMIDLIICFSPSVNVANGFRATFSNLLNCRFDGRMGSLGTSLTYQSTSFIDDSFWPILAKYRVLAVFDEIHHCAGLDITESNSWGERIIVNIQDSVTYTLAMTGTPWRSDELPITLASYSSPEGRIICNYQYSLKQAVQDNVCRRPKLVLIDYESLHYLNGPDSQSYSSLQLLMENKGLNYSDVLQNTDALTHILQSAVNKLNTLRVSNQSAGGLVVASSISHAKQIQQILIKELKQNCVLVSYQDPIAHKTIEVFKQNDTPWIVSIGMISEGTDIPRLQVCCHLSNIRTELYFRQVLGRILRITDAIDQEAWLYTFAEENMVRFCEEIEQDIPDSCLYLKQKENKLNVPDLIPVESEERIVSATQTNLGTITCSNPTNDSQERLNSPVHHELQLDQLRKRVIEVFSNIA
ncbi:DEAD/DEAH box helicase [Vibrio owensii]|uniref:DEAD/DEAH box helicase n=1 Tax=Vibrio owensii TaxID=696485 RepID=UPI003CE47729